MEENIVFNYIREKATEYAAEFLIDEYPDATNDERMKHAQEAFDKGMERALKEVAYYSTPWTEARKINAVKVELAHRTCDDDLATEAAEDWFGILESELPMGDE